MGYQTYIKRKGGIICFLLALLLFIFSLLFNSSGYSTENAAIKAGKHIRNRMTLLDSYVSQALESDHSEWLELPDIPDDIVIYRYIYDTLQSWSNQFTINNDDISSKLIFQQLSNLRVNLQSPLSTVTQNVSFINLGPKWYLAKAATDSINCKVIAGLEIKNTLLENHSKRENGINRHLKIPGKFDIKPLFYSGGSAVYFKGVPVFKIFSEINYDSPLFANSIMRWIALMLLLISSALYLWKKKTLRLYSLNIVFLIGATVLAYFWGVQLQGTSNFFSPTIYADGRLLSSFGALFTLNMTVFLFVASTYIIRKRLAAKTYYSGRRILKYLYVGVVFLLLAGTVYYIHFTLQSLIMNSNISLELFRWDDITIYTVIVYVSYTSLLVSCLFLMQMFAPLYLELTGRRLNLFSKKALLIFSCICAVYFTCMSGMLGFKKEQNRITVWSNRLAVDRNLSLELQLRSVEKAIEEDPIIAALALAKLDGSNVIILNRISENYLSRLSQQYDISISLLKNANAKEVEYINRILMSGTQIAPGSNFLHTHDNNYKSHYLGQFIYYSKEEGVVRMIMEISSKSDKEDRGYYNIFHEISRPGSVNIPQFYSYAKYISGQLVSYKGTFAYPTIMTNKLKAEIAQNNKWFKADGYIHFITKVSNDEYILVSRQIRGAMTYFVTMSYLILIAYSGLFLFSSDRGKKKIFRKNYFRSRINTILFIALFLTLVVMAAVSVTFVYKRNESNMKTMMSSKINTIQALMDARCRYVNNYAEMNAPEQVKFLENISNTTKSDITLYTPGGKVFRSTTPEVFDRMLIGTRINEEAYNNLRYKYQRFYIHKENFAKNTYYTLYAPIFNANGKMIMIVGTPFTDQSYVFKSDAFFHAATIINLFLILLAVTLLISTTVVNAMFKPLIEMGQKMSSANIHGLEYIIYKREDEISTLVDAYNRMVHDLSENTKKLAQAERDKAWSEMARQVAHEIKNPLTPIKLEIQRLIRMKQKNDPAWESKFDKVSSIILEHIDILTDTANEFSTFAKLYSEEPVLIDLDRTLKDQLAIFDNKDNIEISYFGMPDAVVLAPKPQLIRVFVNLITNAIQAVEIQQKEEEERGDSITGGKIFICIRNSIKDGFYDIVFEDNGPGVKEENLGKLFTPNFTTKSGGTGLGLAICRNIVEKCNGEILYQKSFVMKGACFTVRLPRHQ